MTGVATPTFLADVHIMIVEDEYLIALDLSDNLKAYGATAIDLVSSVKEALAAIRTGQTLDWVILDINLGGEFSFAVADALREREIPFVFSTGYEDSMIPTRFADIPRQHKPTSVPALLTLFPRKPV